MEAARIAKRGIKQRKPDQVKPLYCTAIHVFLKTYSTPFEMPEV
jgi:hypothetical protein